MGARPAGRASHPPAEVTGHRSGPLLQVGAAVWPLPEAEAAWARRAGAEVHSAERPLPEAELATVWPPPQAEAAWARRAEAAARSAERSLPEEAAVSVPQEEAAPPEEAA